MTLVPDMSGIQILPVLTKFQPVVLNPIVLGFVFNKRLFKIAQPIVFQKYFFFILPYKVKERFSFRSYGPTEKHHFSIW